LSRYGLYSLALLVLLADQASKTWIVAAHWHWPEEGRELIPGFFALTFNVNTGGAFGILPHGTLLLALYYGRQPAPAREPALGLKDN